jgi:hypothetical protein
MELPCRYSLGSGYVNSAGIGVSRAFTMKTTNSRVVSAAIFCGLALSLLFAAAMLPSSSAIWHRSSSDYLSVQEVCHRWGEQPFDTAAFRSAEEDESGRAAMACSLLKAQDDYVGMDPPEIAQLFGNFGGYHSRIMHDGVIM